jgi:nucleoside-diphosphate-sugar epimerase
MKGCQTLINAAADTDHGCGTAQQSHTNLEGTRNLFQSALTAEISRAVPFPHKPSGAYSHTKGEAERIARSFSTQGLAVVVIRPRFIWVAMIRRGFRKSRRRPADIRTLPLSLVDESPGYSIDAQRLVTKKVRL